LTKYTKSDAKSQIDSQVMFLRLPKTQPVDKQRRTVQYGNRNTTNKAMQRSGNKRTENGKSTPRLLIVGVRRLGGVFDYP
jgi:hypothetical protein